MSIINYGWDNFFENQFQQIAMENLFPARVIADYGQQLRVITEAGEKVVNRPINKCEPIQIAVGDWLVLEYKEDVQYTLIHNTLKRKTKFSRAASGIEVKEQIIAANIDTVFIMQSLNRDFNMKRLERYLIASWESGAIPVVILTKLDCCEDLADKLMAVSDTAPGVEIHAISCITKEGLPKIHKYFATGKTVALLGSSGVGKSTLVNTLAGQELLKTNEIRVDDARGRHTTTHRELILLPEGGLVMDTPGMRSLSLWEADTGMEVLYGDIEELITQCRFFDCKHEYEPGCAIQEALKNGIIEYKHWESWLKLQKEIKFLEAKKEGKLRLQEKQWGKQISKFTKELYKERKKYQ